VDVIDVDGLVSSDPVLTLPHPRAAERAFVLVPWLAVQPTARLDGRPVADLVAGLPSADVAAVAARPELVLA
jgi:2-amino-4-hydroxy-6-hydroxymethyldihydropteridine diphosphokinase